MGSRSSKTDTSTLEDPVIVGSVRKPHGVRGEVVVEVLTDVPDRFERGSRLALVPRGQAAERPARWLTVAEARPHQGVLLVFFEGIDDRDRADELRGADLAVGAATSPPPPEDTWYHFQLLGCRCVDATQGDLGEVVDVVEDGGGTLLLVAGEGRTIPVPLVAGFLRRVDVERRVIEVDLPEGLVETCSSRS